MKDGSEIISEARPSENGNMQKLGIFRYNPVFLGVEHIRSLSMSRGGKEGNSAFAKVSLIAFYSLFPIPFFVFLFFKQYRCNCYDTLLLQGINLTARQENTLKVLYYYDY